MRIVIIIFLLIGISCSDVKQKEIDNGLDSIPSLDSVPDFIGNGKEILQFKFPDTVDAKIYQLMMYILLAVVLMGLFMTLIGLEPIKKVIHP